jgi:RNA polymerase sigma-70 factor, ECF subfamily
MKHSPPSGSPESSTDSALLSRVRIRESRAWSQLVAWAGPLVHYWCKQANLSAEDRADVFQDVFTAVLTAINDYDHSQPGASFRGWLHTITRHKIIDLARACLRQPRPGGDLAAYQQFLAETPRPSDSSSASAPPNSRLSALRMILDLIRPDYNELSWQAFWRMVVEGRSSTDVAKELGTTAVNVRQAKARILRRLRAELQTLGE